MLKQILKGEKFIPIKFHGNVKHLIFACNVCAKEFIKPESYYKKQSKMRAHACCFCSPACRSKYLYEHKSPTAAIAVESPIPKPIVETPIIELPKVIPTPTQKRGGIISNFLRSFLTHK